MGAALVSESNRTGTDALVAKEIQAKGMKGRAHVRYRCCAALSTTRPTSNAMVLLLTVVVLTGCVHHYKITLNSGTQIESAGKPRLENGYYYYKDSSGR